MIRILTLVLFLLSLQGAMAQKRVLTVGLQFRPIVPISFINSDFETYQGLGFDYSIAPKFGYSAGLNIRYGITDRVSIESGLGFVQRNYGLTMRSGVVSTDTAFRIIGYELPVLALVFIPLGKRIYMNAAAGVQVSAYPSNVQTGDTTFISFSSRHSLINGGALANLGWEFRTENSGYFYLGATYHLPFADIYNTAAKLRSQPPEEFSKGTLNGSYLTFDIRYLFPEFPLPERRKKSKKKRKKDDENDT